MGINKKGNMVKIRRKRDNGNNLKVPLDLYLKKRKNQELENRLIKGKLEDQYLYWIKRKYERKIWKK